MKLKPLEWNEEANVGTDGINRQKTAIEELVAFGGSIQICYSVNMCGVNRRNIEEVNPRYFAWAISDGECMREEVDSFEAGKNLCEHWRKKFWNSLYDNLMEQIFEEDEK